MKTLHDEFYDFRDKVWKSFEKLVQEGCEIHGDLPIVVGEYNLPANGLRTTIDCLTDVCDITINAIIANKDYCIFPKKESEKDIIITTNKIKVKISKWCNINGKYIDLEIEVEPDILNLQSLSTYISGGYSCFN
jgi:hypothetical protein